MQKLLPPNWPQPRGYSNGIVAEGRQIFIAGQIGWDETQTIVSDDFVPQFRKVLENTLLILKEADAGPEHIVRMTGFITNRDEYLGNLKHIGAIWKELMGSNYPVMAFVIVSGLIEKRAKVEIETTAVISS
jgi:enamine deaminase RidA (YjgF/YER057c/UK114 family)